MALDNSQAQGQRRAPAFAVFLSLPVTPPLVLGLGPVVATVDFPNLVSILFGTVLLAGGCAPLPRPARFEATINRGEDLPALFAVVNGVGQALGAPPVTGIVFDGGFYAHATEVRVNRRKERLLGIGPFCGKASTKASSSLFSTTSARIC